MKRSGNGSAQLLPFPMPGRLVIAMQSRATWRCCTRRYSNIKATGSSARSSLYVCNCEAGASVTNSSPTWQARAADRSTLAIAIANANGRFGHDHNKTTFDQEKQVCS